MSVQHRFSRLRDGTLRVRVTFAGDDLDLPVPVWGDSGRWCRPGEPWRRDLVLTGEQVDRFVTASEGAGGDLEVLGTKLRAHRDTLAAHPPQRRQGPVVDDAALRDLVRARLDAAGGWVLEEFSVQAARVRADLAVITDDEWTGVELKGHTDSLTRLPRQVAAYSATFDRCELVTVPRHLEHALALLPTWWAVSVVDDSGLRQVRAGQTSPLTSALARVQILWREEAQSLVRTHVPEVRGLAKLRRDELSDLLGQHLEPDAARRLVTAAMHRRRGWVDERGRHLPMFT